MLDTCELWTETGERIEEDNWNCDKLNLNQRHSQLNCDVSTSYYLEERQSNRALWAVVGSGVAPQVSNACSKIHIRHN